MKRVLLFTFLLLLFPISSFASYPIDPLCTGSGEYWNSSNSCTISGVPVPISCGESGTSYPALNGTTYKTYTDTNHSTCESSCCSTCPPGYICDGGSYNGWSFVPGIDICSATTYCPSTGMTTATTIPAGQECSAAVGVTPPASPVGSTGCTAITNCLAGRYCTGGARHNCTVGHFCPTGSSSETPCAPGYYCPNQNMALGSDCGTGYYCPGYTTENNNGTSNPGAVQRNPLSGYYCSDDGTPPTINGSHSVSQHQCESGYYCSGGGRSDCPANYGQSPAGSTTNTQCKTTCSAGTRVATAYAACTTPAGNWFSPNSHDVNYGSQSSSATSTQANAGTNFSSYNVWNCNTGYHVTDQTTPVASDHDAQDDCKITCAGGTHLATAYATSCAAVLTGYFAAEHDVSQGSASSQGFYDSGTTSPATYTPTNGQYKNCPTYYANSDSGLDEITDCYLSCSAGQYVLAAYGTCELCPAGSQCAGGKVYWGTTGAPAVACEAGYYCDNTGKHRCPMGASSEADGQNQAATDCFIPSAIDFADTVNTFNFQQNIPYK